MIKYKCRPAIHTKMVCEYCELINFELPDEYSHFQYLSDEDLIGFYTITNLFNFIEQNTSNHIFFFDFVKNFIQRIESFTKIDFSSNVSNASKLLAFTQFYNQISDVNWHSIETDDSVGLVSKRAKKSLAAKYGDLFIYASVMHVLKLENEDKSSLIIELPFSSGFYGSNVELMANVKFNCENLSVFVKKDHRDGIKMLPYNENSISNIERINAAAKTIPPAELSLVSLANRLGISARSLQREVKAEGCCVKGIIKKVRANYIISILSKNDLNVKVTAYECGFKNLSTFSRHFKSTIGSSPTDYVESLKLKSI
ncbi:helix-turn-helix transcriptional regulator [Shewanella olleyana]|uniref:helix-turn-helix transcriptional regulator n=1 Tax=Shewanella olleyana TaxID=135626 RepID=UPI00200BEE70|nr:helix-turn-helix transcriptional regulator [Shewanella olleyana]MCL1066132.1 helix-turn-helix transcriptional regulator [Shewanella olleyana]